MNPQYEKYIESDEWKLMRMRIIRRDRVCVVCGIRVRLDIHHFTYLHFEHELDEELVAICRWHHDKVHYNALGVKLKFSEKRMIVRLLRLIVKGKQKIQSQYWVDRFADRL